MPYLRSETCFFQALCIYRWMQVLQGRLCCSLKHLVNAGGFSHRIENYEINHVLSVEKTKPTNQNPHTPRKGVWANEFHCRHFLVWRLFFCCVLFGFYFSFSQWEQRIALLGPVYPEFYRTVVCFANPAD